MSLKLLKQSVDIVEDGTKSTDQKKKAKKSTTASHTRKALHATIRDHQLDQRKRNIKDVQKELAAKGNKSNENIKRLLALSMNTVKVKDAEKMVQRAHKGRYVKKIIPKVEQESIFTEEDFRKFEEEYFNS